MSVNNLLPNFAITPTPSFSFELVHLREYPAIERIVDQWKKTAHQKIPHADPKKRPALQDCELSALLTATKLENIHRRVPGFTNCETYVCKDVNGTVQGLAIAIKEGNHFKILSFVQNPDNIPTNSSKPKKVHGVKTAFLAALETDALKRRIEWISIKPVSLKSQATLLKMGFRQYADVIDSGKPIEDSYMLKYLPHFYIPRTSKL